MFRYFPADTHSFDFQFAQNTATNCMVSIGSSYIVEAVKLDHRNPNTKLRY